MIKEKSIIFQEKESGRSTVIAEIHHRVCMLQTMFFLDRAGFTNAISVMV
jgi:hypothetical protein